MGEGGARVRVRVRVRVSGEGGVGVRVRVRARPTFCHGGTMCIGPNGVMMGMRLSWNCSNLTWLGLGLGLGF